MIIKFSKNIELSDWDTNPQPDLKGYPNSIGCYHRLYKDYQNRWVIGTTVRRHPFLSVTDKCYAMFYHDLLFCHEFFPSIIDGDLEFAKDYVDKFLIKVSGLRAFA